MTSLPQGEAPSVVGALELLEGWGENWIVAKGRLTAAEPPYGCQLMAGEEVVAEGEGETLLQAVSNAFDQNGIERHAPQFDHEGLYPVGDYRRGLQLIEREECDEVAAAYYARQALAALSTLQADGGFGALRPTGSVPTEQAETPVVGWQPIETAPRDGTDVLIWNAEGAEIAHWAPKEDDGPDQPGCDEGWHGSYAWPGRSWGNRLQPFPQGQPTHWMPLPPAPTDTTGGGS